MDAAIGIIGGSGLYDIAGLESVEWVEVATPFGPPSDALLTGRLGERRVVFLPRHGRGHRLPPASLNYRANIFALKALGATRVISLSAVGSLREDLAPGTFVLVDQFIDRTIDRRKSFFGPGLVAHVSMADPVCGCLADTLASALGRQGTAHAVGGTYLAMEGPQFSTRAESELYRAWGCAVIGMTNMPEAKLAREAELCYASVAMVTDYDCWHDDHEAVTVETIIRVLHDNAARAKDLVRAAVPLLDPAERCPQGCDRALDAALITAPEARDPAMLRDLAPIVARVLNGAP